MHFSDWPCCQASVHNRGHFSAKILVPVLADLTNRIYCNSEHETCSKLLVIMTLIGKKVFNTRT